MKIPRPKTVQIGARVYSIEFTPNLIRNRQARGFYNGDRSEIEIEPEQSDNLKTATLWHEFLHAIQSVFFGDCETFTDQQTDVLANGLHQVLESMGIEIDWEE